MKTFDSLFVERTSSILLQIENLNHSYKSKVGGLPPVFFDGVEFSQGQILEGYRYLFTLSDDFSSFINGNDLSVFIPNGYDDYSQKTIYPDFNLKCFIHEHTSELSKNTNLVYTSVKEGSLIPIVKNTDNDEEYTYFIKIGSNPYLLQEEQYFYSDLESNGFEFIFQLDENGFNSEHIDGNYPFGFGSVYFYAKIDYNTKSIVDVVSGYWQT